MPSKILIVGCSVAGPVLATFLLLSDMPAEEKPHITILERAPKLRTQGQNIDIRGSGITIMRKLGLEKIIRAYHTGEAGVQHVDHRNRVWAAVAADKTGKHNTPTADIEILRGRLAEICVHRSRLVSEAVNKEGGAGIEYIFGDKIDQIDQDGKRVVVRFNKSGERRSFDLVVGADGLQSSTRRLAWAVEGEKDRLLRLGLYAAFFSLPRGESDTEWRRWFHGTKRRSIMLRPHEKGDRTTALMILSEPNDERLPKAMMEGPRAQKLLLREYFQDAGWESERILADMDSTEDFYYDVVGQVKLDKLSKGRVILVGDAGYGASFISGMGTTLAFTGAYHLAGALTRHSDDYEAAFRQYELAMRPLIDEAQGSVPGRLWIFKPNSAWQLWALNSLFYFFSCIGPVLGLLIHFLSPSSEAVPVEDYGFRELSEEDMGTLEESST